MRATRENTLKILFQQEFTQNPLDESLKHFREYFIKDEPVNWEFIQAVTSYVHAHREDLDQQIASLANNWKLERLALVDLLLLRIAIAEIKLNLTPFKVAINENLEVAKVYSSKDSVGFINGVLDQWGKEHGATE
ncbi:MAG: transcription antitermination factor NusB [Bdellovibrionaceae bacterium]|nr:transcription antitermination factor NusB [Pseudobdellovibrionaceae bacterium]